MIAGTATRKKKASGVNIPNQQRGTEMLLLRVSPEVDAAYRELSRQWRLNLADTLSELMRRAGVDLDD